ncbi:hypothetical protein AEAC466_07385 [Asticcacaulis sp. AC466]|uniref:hypothetical protein n=1 Tax=Asticcacaulis sp. AC466 TaxID=1282362 RepID=UPI0003C3BCD1|nr:hypothetical protein [Asticcacaulis sp. AC466]ESQ84871.1 hypothetical protein AEAC466_07385 [Asticcacaulis sp. AC466]
METYFETPTTDKPSPDYATIFAPPKDTLQMKADRLLTNYRNLPKTSLALAGLAGIGVLAILGGLWAGKSALFHAMPTRTKPNSDRSF